MQKGDSNSVEYNDVMMVLNYQSILTPFITRWHPTLFCHKARHIYRRANQDHPEQTHHRAEKLFGYQEQC